MNFEEFTYQTFEALYNDNCSMIPNEKGIYIVIVPDTVNVEFSDQTTAITEFGGKSLLYPIDNLKLKFDKTDEKVLYIAKAGEERNKLRQRIASGTEHFALACCSSLPSYSILLMRHHTADPWQLGNLPMA